MGRNREGVENKNVKRDVRSRDVRIVCPRLKARSRSYCCHSKAVSITCSECVSQLSSSQSSCVVLHCRLWPAVPYFPTLSHK
jgi:hypothetical protein